MATRPWPADDNVILGLASERWHRSHLSTSEKGTQARVRPREPHKYRSHPGLCSRPFPIHAGLKVGATSSDMPNSSTHILFKDGTSSAAEQPVIETTAPSNSLASMMANWELRSPSPALPSATVKQTEPAEPGRDGFNDKAAAAHSTVCHSVLTAQPLSSMTQFRAI